MKKNLKDLFDNFSDETVDIKTSDMISPDKIIALTKKKIKEDTTDMNTPQKTIRVFLIAAAIVAAFSITALAAYQFLSSGEVAKQLEDHKLAEYFSKEDIKFNFEPQTSGDYTFQLLGIASGKNLSDFADTDSEKSYIVGAISRADGKKLTDAPDIMVTPLVAGYKPWQVNAFTLDSGKRSFLHNGTDYFIFECDNIEIFADPTIYIAAYEGIAPGAETFRMEADGSIRFQDSYEGVKAMFTLPMDPSKADPQAVQKLLNDIGSSDDGSVTDIEQTSDDFKIVERRSENGVEFVISEK